MRHFKGKILDSFQSGKLKHLLLLLMLLNCLSSKLIFSIKNKELVSIRHVFVFNTSNAVSLGCQLHVTAVTFILNMLLRTVISANTSLEKEMTTLPAETQLGACLCDPRSWGSNPCFGRS